VSGPPPNVTRRRRNKPAGGEWKPAPGVGWQHGDIPAPPDGLMTRSRAIWDEWFKGWWAANWTADYLSQIEKAIKLYDATERGEFKATSELRQWMDGIGVTFKGQQMLRWQPPKGVEQPTEEPVAPKGGRFAHLRAVG
jgi:hypothetical protein